MAWFMLAMILHPEAQKRAQEEIDRVIVSERLPSLADKSSLPYIGALCSECLRYGQSVLRITREPW